MPPYTYIKFLVQDNPEICVVQSATDAAPVPTKTTLPIKAALELYLALRNAKQPHTAVCLSSEELTPVYRGEVHDWR